MTTKQLDAMVDAISAVVLQRMVALETRWDVRAAHLDGRLVALETREAVPGPPGPIGERGERGEKGLDGSAGPIGSQGDPGPAGERGIDGRDGRDGKDGKDGRDGVDGTDGQSGPKGDKGIDGANGKDGIDGFGLEDFSLEYDGERGLTLVFERGELRKSFTLHLPMMLYRGVFEDGKSYVVNDCVTWGGSGWIAKQDTTDKPGTSKAWQLAIKAGRDGREGKAGPSGPPGPRGDKGDPGPPRY